MIRRLRGHSPILRAHGAKQPRHLGPRHTVETWSSNRGFLSRRRLDNCVPFWYWFGELLIPGFIGDRRADVLKVAANVAGTAVTDESPLGVKYSVEVRYGTG